MGPATSRHSAGDCRPRFWPAVAALLRPSSGVGGPTLVLRADRVLCWRCPSSVPLCCGHRSAGWRCLWCLGNRPPGLHPPGLGSVPAGVTPVHAVSCVMLPQAEVVSAEAGLFSVPGAPCGPACTPGGLCPAHLPPCPPCPCSPLDMAGLCSPAQPGPLSPRGPGSPVSAHVPFARRSLGLGTRVFCPRVFFTWSLEVSVSGPAPACSSPATGLGSLSLPACLPGAVEGPLVCSRSSFSRLLLTGAPGMCPPRPPLVTGPSPRPTPAPLLAHPPWCELLPLTPGLRVAPPCRRMARLGKPLLPGEEEAGAGGRGEKGPHRIESAPREATLSVCRARALGPHGGPVSSLCGPSRRLLVTRALIAQASRRGGMRGLCMWSGACVTGQGPAGARASLQLPPAAGRRLCLEFSVRGVVSSPAFSLCAVAQRPIPRQSSGAGVPGGSPSVSQFSRSVVSDSLRLRGPQHARPPCPSPTTPGVHPNSCPLSQ